ncbi:aspartate aminotransferase family protein [Rhizobium sp. 9140]|uniref:aspartate aminotransferase family protein n=1 Tax=Rhizobium sp. 9140 TaxID=1761900 RepID=UPI00079BD844|nr:aminotransferase class III-fold pyridoxal phosphate-dependent enzyme [Rhizobium sp. 9140]CZT36901.1 glutamate-1-semialdehyde 2,1-aminomutase [Rhizobium sp. 9140]
MTNHLVGGISSAGRALPCLDGERFLASRSEGAYVWDGAQRRYIDTALGFGATVIGHAHPAVVEAVTAAVRNGPMPAFAHDGEEQAAALLTSATRHLSSVIFTNTGSEAVHLACRLARAATGRTQIAKMAAGYDGWYDDVTLGQAGSLDADMVANARPTRERTTLLRFNDFDDVERLFAENADIAAVIVEPMLANSGCIPAAPGYLAYLEATARRHGALVILDEVLMGFRTGFGLAGHGLGIEGDIATVGKAIGSGIAVAAVVGRPELMALAEAGAVVRAGTYSGNPVATAAVTATFQLLKDLDYAVLQARGRRLRQEIGAAFSDQGLPVATSGEGSVFTIWFSDSAPSTYAEAKAKASAALTLRLHETLRRRGLLIMPFAFGRLYLSDAHSDAVIGDMVGIFRDAARDMAA